MNRIVSDVFELDLGFEGTMSAYLVDGDASCLIETGGANSFDRLVAELDSAGSSVGDLDSVVVSHIHLDHAGGVASLVKATDGLDVYLHEVTVRHLVDPEVLIESSRDVLGAFFEELGAPQPVPEEAITPVSGDGRIRDAALRVIETPGHSPDHLSVWDPSRRIVFANEAIGRYYARSDCWVPPVTLPRYDPRAVRRSIDVLEGLDPEVVALSHGGTHTDEVFARARDRLDRFHERIPALFEATGSVEETVTRVKDELVRLPDYSTRTWEMQAEICTAGVLDFHDLR